MWNLFHCYGKEQEDFKQSIDVIVFAFKTTFAAVENGLDRSKHWSKETQWEVCSNNVGIRSEWSNKSEAKKQNQEICWW